MPGWIRLCMLGLLGVAACSSPRWWSPAKQAGCDPSQRDAIAKAALWASVFAKGKQARACLLVRWGPLPGEGAALLVDVHATGKVMAAGRADSPQYAVPRSAGSQRSFHILVFGAALQRAPAGQQRSTCEAMAKLDYRCAASEGSECWFYWRMSGQAAQERPSLQCELHSQPGPIAPPDREPPQGPPDRRTPPGACSPAVDDLEQLRECTRLSYLQIEGGSGPLTFPNLTKIDGYLSVDKDAKSPQLSFPRLRTIGSYLDFDGSRVHKASFPQLESIGSYVSIEGNPKLTELSMPKLETVGGYFSVVGNPMLKVLHAPSLKRVESYLEIATNGRLCLDAVFAPQVGGYKKIEGNQTSCP